MTSVPFRGPGIGAGFDRPTLPKLGCLLGYLVTCSCFHGVDMQLRWPPLPGETLLWLWTERLEIRHHRRLNVNGVLRLWGGAFFSPRGRGPVLHGMRSLVMMLTLGGAAACGRHQLRVCRAGIGADIARLIMSCPFIGVTLGVPGHAFRAVQKEIPWKPLRLRPNYPTLAVEQIRSLTTP